MNASQKEKILAASGSRSFSTTQINEKLHRQKGKLPPKAHSTQTLPKALSPNLLSNQSDTNSSLGSSSVSQLQGNALGIYYQDVILRGNLERIKQPKRALVRLYFSSNPQDSSLERTALWGHVVPSLRKHCSENYDIEFQVVDLNAGPDNGLLVSKKRRLKEIKICRESSISTSFVALVGHKYWSPSIPNCIDCLVFDNLLKIAYEAKLPNCRLLEECYQRDENAVPPHYNLKSPKEILSCLTNGCLNSQNGTSNVATTLRNLLHTTATTALETELITVAQADLFLTSNFETEIQGGILSASGHDVTKCVCYVRTINDMDTDMNYGRVCDYIDIQRMNKDTAGLYVTDDMLDQLALSKLELIREGKLPEKVIASDGQLRVYKCAVTWMPQVGLQNESHKEYIDDFCSQLRDVVTQMTDENIHRLQERKVSHEVMCHCLIAKDLHQLSHELGQDAAKTIHEYISKPSTKPMLVHGCKGSGKTYLMSTVASEIFEWYNAASNPICAVRFLGHTYVSSYTVLLLDSLCSQLEKCFGIQQEPLSMWYTDVSFQKKRFVSLLNQASFYQPIIILLDGVDQLRDADDVSSLSAWLPCTLPDHVKLIVSVDSDSSVYCQMSTTSKQSFSVVNIKPMSPSECSKHIRHMLNDDNRRITSGQHVFAMQSLNTENKNPPITPCKMHLIHTHAADWKSSKDVTKDTIGQDETAAIRHFMLDLQEKYGVYLVRVTAKLITASNFGLTEQELEEILVKHDGVISDLQAKHPRLKNISKSDISKEFCSIQSALSVSLINLLRDISPFLMRKLLVGCQVYCWSNTVIKGVMTSLYLSNIDEKQSALNALVKYYLDYIKRGQYPTNQTVPLKTVHIAIELPFLFELQGSQSDVMRYCFLNFYWLSAILKAYGTATLLFFLEKAYLQYNDRSVLVVERSTRLSVNLLQCTTSVFAGELFSRVVPFVKVFPCLKELISQCCSQKHMVSTLLPAGIHAQAPGAPLRVSFGEPELIVNKILAYQTGASINLVYCTLNRLKFFDMINGDLLREMVFNEPIEWMRITANKQHIVILSGHKHELYFLEEKSCSNKRFSLEARFQNCQPFSIKDIDAVASKTHIAVWVRNHSEKVLLFDAKSASVVHELICNDQVHRCLISEDEQFVYAVVLPRTIVVFSKSKGKILCNLGPASLPSMGHVVNLFENFEGNLLGVYSSGFVHVWGKGDFAHLFELDSRCSSSRQHYGVIHTSMSPDQQWLALVKPTEIDIWNLKKWKTECEVFCRQNELFATAYFAKEQNYLLVTLAGDDFSLYVWDITSAPPTCVSIIDGHMNSVRNVIVPFIKDLSFSPWVVTASDNTIKVWNLENLPLLPTLAITGRPISKAFWMGNYTVSSDKTDKITVWRVCNADIAFQLKHAAPVSHIVVSTWSSKAVTADEAGYQYVWNLHNGENLFKMKGRKVKYLLITPNDQLVVSVFQHQHSGDEDIEPSRVWKINTGQVVCTFNYMLKDIQITSKNTFLVGISEDQKIHAVGLWTGLLAKVLCRPGFMVTMVHALSWHDHVISLDSGNFVTVWNIAEETSLMSLDMKDTIMDKVCISDSGAILTIVDPTSNIKVLDVTHGKLRKVNTYSCPLITQLTWDGVHLVYICDKKAKDKDGCVGEAQFCLVLTKIIGSRSTFIYPLESVPTSMMIAKTGQAIVVGFEEGRVIVFNIVGQDTKVSSPSEYKPKKVERKKFFPKEMCDQTWLSEELTYDQSYHMDSIHSSTSAAERHGNFKGQAQGQEATQKFSIHMPRSVKYEPQGAKSKNMRQLGNTTSKVKVFM